MQDNIEFSRHLITRLSDCCVKQWSEPGLAVEVIAEEIDSWLRARQAPAPVEVSRMMQAACEALTELVTDAREVFCTSSQRTPQVVRDAIEYMSSGMEVFFRKRIDSLVESTPVGEVPAGWVPLRITYPGDDPEDVAFGPQYMMDRLQKWLSNYFAMLEREKLAASPAPAASKVPTMEDALAAGDGTLHGAIDYWQNRALAAEAARDVDDTNKVLADNYIELTAASKGAEAVARVRRYKTPEGYEHWEFVGERYPFFDLPHGEHVLVLASPSPAASMEVQGLDANAIRLATLEEAARACEKLAEERFNDHGTREPDTGACYYGGRIEEEYQTRDEEDNECAKAIRALAAKNGWRLGEGRD